MSNEPGSTVGRVGRRLGAEHGQTLVLALIVMSVLTIVTGAMIQYETSNETAFARDGQATRALHIADAGLNNAISVLAAKDPSDSLPVGTMTTVPTTSFSLDVGTGTYSAQKTAPDTWTVSSIGTSPNGKVTRQLQTTVHATTSTSPGSPAYSYGLFVPGTPQSPACGGNDNTLSGASSVSANVYIGGNLCTSGSASLLESAAHTHTVYIGGVFSTSGAATIGASGSTFLRASIVGGCKNGGTAICSNSSSSHVYADNYDSTPQSQAKPALNPDAVYASGNWHTPTCTTGSFVFDSNTTRSTNPGATVEPFPTGGPSYDCTVSDSGGNQVGRLAWNASTKVATISGTIFIDNNVIVKNNMTYVGSGTLYADGTFTTSGGPEVCGYPAVVGLNHRCSGTWNPNEPNPALRSNMEIVAVNAANASPGFGSTGNTELDITAYAVGQLLQSGGGLIRGTVIADSINFSGGSGVSVATLPIPGQPGAGTTNTNWTVVPGSWSELK